MRALLMAFVVVGVGLAGCAGGGSKEDPASQTKFDDLAVEVTATTGVILGIVVDAQIRPVADAQVTLRGAGKDLSAATDVEGRFVFDNLEPGTYFLTVTSNLHKEVQTSAEVVAGVADPPITRIQVERLFSQDPYSVQIVQEGFFECSQAGSGLWLYASSNCVVDPYRRFCTSPAPCYPSPTQPMDNITQQKREWHADVESGWQQMVFEMTWEPTAQGTSPNMGIVISTYKPTRSGSHWFAQFEGSSPMRGQIDQGGEHETASGEDPTEIPAEGMQNMSYFVAVRPEDPGCTLGCVPPGFAINQKFTVYLTMFHYGKPPEGWSLVAGDPLPF